MKKTPASTSVRRIAQLVIASLVLTSPGGNVALVFAEANRVVLPGQRAGLGPVRAAGAPKIAAPLAAGLAAPALPVYGSALPARAEASPALKSALLSLDEAAARSLPLSDPQADPLSLKGGTGRPFGETAAGRSDVTTVDTGPQGPASGMSVPGKSALLGRSIQKKSVPPTKKPFLASLKNHARWALPKLALAAGIAAVGWAAHAAGRPELMVGALPMLAGVIRNQGGGGSAGPAPIEDRLLAKIKENHKPGQMLTSSRLAELSRQAGLTDVESRQAPGTLAQKGHLAIFNNRLSFFVALEDDRTLPAELVGAGDMVRRAVGFINSQNPAQHARALSLLSTANELYNQAKEPKELVEKNGRQISMLKYNAVFEILRDLEAAAEAKAKDKGLYAPLKAYLDAAYFDLHHFESRAPYELRAGLGELAKGEPAEAYRQHDAFRDIQEGFSLAASYIHYFADTNALTSEETKTQAPAATPKLANRLLEEIALQIRPGLEITDDIQARLADSLDSTKEAVAEGLKDLAARNLLSYFNQRFLYTSVPALADERNADKDLDEANRLAVRGIELLNGPSLSQNALALLDFEEAASKYETFYALSESKPAVISELRLLAANAKAEILRDMAVIHYQNLDQTEDGEAPRQAAAHAIHELGHLYYTTASPAPSLDQDARQWLLSNLQGFTVEAYGIKGNPAEQKILEAIGSAWEVLNGFPGQNDDTEWTPEPDSQPEEQPKPKPRGKPRKQADTVKIDPKNPQAANFDLIAPDNKAFGALNAFGDNISRKAVAGTLHPHIGGQDKLDEIAVVLGRARNNNPVILGEPGVGKTALVEAFAQAIVNGEYPDLKDVNIVQLDLSKMVAGTKYRGQFEERMKAVLQEIRRANADRIHVLVFIDEIHNIVGAGGAEGAMDAAQMLLQPLQSGELRAIGATTLDDYRKHMEKNGALTRRFGVITIDPPTREEAVAIVEGSLSYYENYHSIKIPEQVAQLTVDLAMRNVHTKQLPSSALEIIDNAGSRMKLDASKARAAGAAPQTEMTLDHLSAEVSRMTGIPAGAVGPEKRKRLKAFKAAIKEILIGQDEIVDPVIDAVIRAEQGFKDPRKPNGAFIFLGPTGVGKTALAETIAAYLFGSPERVIKLDMGNFGEKHEASGLKGAPPGYVGYEDAPQLTEAVRRHPYSVVLLDEIEKAHQDVFDPLLEALDKGKMKDAQARVADFKNTIIIMTSNLGSREVKESAGKESLGFGSGKAVAEQAADKRKETQRAALRSWAKPEFLNRVGEENIFVFNDLSRDSLMTILENQIGLYNKAVLGVEDKQMHVTVTEAAKNFLLDVATTEENQGNGARPLERALHKHLGDALSAELLEDHIAKGDRLIADYDPATKKIVIRHAENSN